MRAETTAADAPGRRSRRATCWRWPGCAGIQAAKRTPDLIPLCHPLLVGSVHRELPRSSDNYIEVEASGRDRRSHRRRDGGAHAPAPWPRSRSTTCASRPTARWSIGDIALWEKTGGRSGTYRRAGKCSTSMVIPRGDISLGGRCPLQDAGIVACRCRSRRIVTTASRGVRRTTPERSSPTRLPARCQQAATPRLTQRRIAILTNTLVLQA